MLQSSLTQSLSEVQKIAVVRVNGLGDFLFIVPALHALHAAYPHAEIVLLGKQWHADFLAGRPGPVNRVVVVPPIGGVGQEPGYAEDANAVERFFKQMQQEQFDLACQLHGGGHYSNPFTLRLGATTTIGLKTPDALPLDRWIPYLYFQHEILRYLEVVALVGASPVMLEPMISVTECDRVEAQRMMPRSIKRLVALHPGATDPRRRWPPEKFAEVGDALAAKGATILVVGTPDEAHLTRSIVTTMHHKAYDLCGKLSLNSLTSLLAYCDLLIANDSGPRHLAAAVGTATVSIYWCFNLINAGPLTRDLHRPLVSWQLACPICGVDASQAHCEHQASFVENITAEEVVEQAFDLLS